MSALEELGAAVTAVAARVGPAIVGIGSRQRGSGIVLADGQVLTNAHNLHGDEVTVYFADGRRCRRDGARHGYRRRPGGHRLTRRRGARWVGATAVRWASGLAVFGRGATPTAGAAGDRRLRVGDRAGVPRAPRAAACRRQPSSTRRR